MPARDGDLLARFAGTGDERAFGEIVSRHAGLVQAVALRTTGDPGLAEEVVQNVFALLARKAAEVSRHPQLGGWLHRSTVYESLRRARTERRHRLKLAACTRTLEAPSGFAATAAFGETEAADLQRMHRSIQRLRESDRRVILLRFMEGQSHAAIAGLSGKSEEAVKKQTSRALERLRTLMLRSGSRVSTAALVQSLIISSAAPDAAAAHALSAAALKSAHALTWKTLTLHAPALMKASTIATTAAALLVCGMAFVRQEKNISLTQARLRQLEEQQAAALTSPGTVGSPPGANDPPGTHRETVDSSPATASRMMDIEQVAADIEGRETPFQAAAQTAARERIAVLNGPNLVWLIADTRRLSGGAARQLQIRSALFEELVRRDALLALQTLPEVMRGANEGASTTINLAVRTALSDLLKRVPDAALEEYTKLSASGILDGKGTTSNAPNMVYGPFVGQLFAVNPEKATKLYGVMNLDGKLNAITQMVEIEEPGVRSLVLEEIAKLEPRWQNSSYGYLLAGTLSRQNLAAAGEMLKSFKLEPARAAEVAADFVSDTYTGRARVYLTVPERLEWLKQQLPPAEAGLAGGMFLSRSREICPREAWVDRISDAQRMQALRAFDWGSSRDQAITAFLSRREPPQEVAPALNLAVEIKNPALRLETLQRLGRRFANKAEEYRQALANASTLSAQEKAGALQP